METAWPDGARAVAGLRRRAPWPSIPLVGATTDVGSTCRPVSGRYARRKSDAADERTSWPAATTCDPDRRLSRCGGRTRSTQPTNRDWVESAVEEGACATGDSLLSDR